MRNRETSRLFLKPIISVVFLIFDLKSYHEISSLTAGGGGGGGKVGLGGSHHHHQQDCRIFPMAIATFYDIKNSDVTQDRAAANLSRFTLGTRSLADFPQIFYLMT